jgi:hypothetical protein
MFLPQRQAAQEAQDRELDERRLQGIAVASYCHPHYSDVHLRMHRQVEQQFQKLMQSPLRNSFRLDSSNASASFFDEASSPLASVSRSSVLETRGLL